MVVLAQCACGATSGDSTAGSPDRLGASDPDSVSAPDNDVNASHALSCDGGDEIRFAGAMETHRPNAGVYFAWGFRFDWFVVIDGSCRFWISGDAENGSPVKAGVLNEALVAGLGDDLQLGAWSDFVSAPGVADQGVVHLSDANERYTCPVAGCGMTRMDEVVTAAASLPDALSAQGTEHTAAGVLSLRLLADDAGAAPMSIPEELENLIDQGYPAAVVDGDYRLIEIGDAELLSWLRDAREEFIANSFAKPDFELRIAARGQRYAAAFRDKTPHEDVYGRFSLFQ